ncbi:hypothetical protein H6P81_000020 [Aristolochia fimbriata]|uniref:Uncharacterized protein n=1 Tax=Aristolochia fimbriata TaxID=158543 RepID=A0AAV7F346_ARIFI|nr:hypothetical protein H6P81_000020 [Aristolochia fimbriata]
MGAGLKKDLRVSRVGPGGSLNAFFVSLIGVISQGLAVSRMAQLRQGKESKKHLTPFMHAPLGRGGDIAQLVELRSCNWVVAITGWMSNCPGVGVGGSPRVPSSGIPGEEDQVGPCEQLDALSPFNPLSEMWQKGRKTHGPTPSSPPRRNYEITPRTPSASRGHRPTIDPVQ